MQVMHLFPYSCQYGIWFCKIMLKCQIDFRIIPKKKLGIKTNLRHDLVTIGCSTPKMSLYILSVKKKRSLNEISNFKNI